MSFLGGGAKDPFEPGKTERENLAKKQNAASGAPDAAGDGSGDGRKNPARPSNTRIAIWIIVAAIGLYMIGSGIFGMVTQGG